MRLKKFLEFIVENKINTEIQLPNDIIEISDAFIEAGKDIFLVGGAVRDFIQGIQPKDYDLVTNALPEESKKILKDFRVSDEQGKNFGVLRIYTQGEPEGYELATYRRDLSGGRDTKGEDKKVEIGSDVTIEDDCNRRDLTINALFYDIKNKQIVDLVGGIQDIKNGTIRAVGDPDKRFTEDRLRICRIFRFAARTGGQIDSKTSEAIKRDNRLKGVGPKDDVSQERIWEEFKKAFKQSKSFKVYLDFYTEFDMWSQVFPEIKINEDVKITKFFEVYISNLFKFNKFDLINKMTQDFKIELSFARKVSFLINLLNFDTINVVELYKKRKIADVDDSVILDWYRVNNINDKQHLAFLKYAPIVNSSELMDKGFSGADLGREIKRLEIENFKKMIDS
jgi:tRNA nucleotidyltransferase/poly(A) polymerase